MALFACLRVYPLVCSLARSFVHVVCLFVCLFVYLLVYELYLVIRLVG